MTADRTWTIAELAEEFGVTHRTIRFYEDRGLITPQRRGTRRIYHPRDRVRLELVLRGKRLGFDLAEIRRIVDMYDEAPGEEGQLRYLLDQIATAAPSWNSGAATSRRRSPSWTRSSAAARRRWTTPARRRRRGGRGTARGRSPRIVGRRRRTAGCRRPPGDAEPAPRATAGPRSEHRIVDREVPVAGALVGSPAERRHEGTSRRRGRGRHGGDRGAAGRAPRRG